MEISDKDAVVGCGLTLWYARTIIADGTIYECGCSCLHERGDWDYYELKCGHKFHTRCLRAWLAYKKNLNCTLCGDLQENNENSWCDRCNLWGHKYLDETLCPRGIEATAKMMALFGCRN